MTQTLFFFDQVFFDNLFSSFKKKNASPRYHQNLPSSPLFFMTQTFFFFFWFGPSFFDCPLLLLQKKCKSALPKTCRFFLSFIEFSRSQQKSSKNNTHLHTFTWNFAQKRNTHLHTSKLGRNLQLNNILSDFSALRTKFLQNTQTYTLLSMKFRTHRQIRPKIRSRKHTRTHFQIRPKSPTQQHFSKIHTHTHSYPSKFAHTAKLDRNFKPTTTKRKNTHTYTR